MCKSKFYFMLLKTEIWNPSSGTGIRKETRSFSLIGLKDSSRDKDKVR